MTITIYGLFDGDKCRYVGQTRHKDSRSKYYGRKWPSFQFRVLATCDWLFRGEVEAREIRRYRAIGQCDLNGTIPEPWNRPGSKRAAPHTVEVIRRDGTTAIIADCDYDHAL